MANKENFQIQEVKAYWKKVILPFEEIWDESAIKMPKGGYVQESNMAAED